MRIYGMLTTTVIQFSTLKHSASYFSNNSNQRHHLPTSSTVGTGFISESTVPDYSSTCHIYNEQLADEIIKKPTYFRGSQDDVHDWLEQIGTTIYNGTVGVMNNKLRLYIYTFTR